MLHGNLQAQFNFPFALPGTGQTDIPAYPVREACNLLANDTLEGTPLFYAMGQALPIFTGNANISGGCLDTSAGGPSAFGYQVSSAFELNMHEQSADTHCDVLVMSADMWTVDQVQNIAGKMLSVHAQEGTCLASQ